MDNKPQSQYEIIIQAPVEKVWEVLRNPALLPQWMPVVKHMVCDEIKVGGTRSCDIETQGQKGHVTERFVEVIPQRKLSWVFDEENFGFSDVTLNLKHVVILTPKNDKTTLVRKELHYELNKEADSKAKEMWKQVWNWDAKFYVESLKDFVEKTAGT